MTRAIFIISMLLAAGMLVVAQQNPETPLLTTTVGVSENSLKCTQCHSGMQPGLVKSWEQSLHAKKGIGCFECHQAAPKESDAISNHYGFTISVLVTPKDCARCHQKQAVSFAESRHSQSGAMLEKIDRLRADRFLAEIVEGPPAMVNGCRGCHGTRVVLATDTKRPIAETYPNFGIGRLNPDGSMGSCVACHPRHDFSMSRVRNAETCGRCHSGPNHPQLEIWRASKHGAGFSDTSRHLDNSQRPLVTGKDNVLLPNCVTCHLGEVRGDAVAQTHNPGERISWQNAFAVSRHTSDWEDKRERMQSVCLCCHGTSYAQSFFTQYDRGIHWYNKAFGKPSSQIMRELREGKKLTSVPLDEKVERDWWKIWHQAGRRSRMGVSMMGAGYVQWQGFFDTSQDFFYEFLPAAEVLQPGIIASLSDSPFHHWLKKSDWSEADVRSMIEKNWQEYRSDQQ